MPPVPWSGISLAFIPGRRGCLLPCARLLQRRRRMLKALEERLAVVQMQVSGSLCIATHKMHCFLLLHSVSQIWGGKMAVAHWQQRCSDMSKQNAN
mmetsp:Transcript_20593/g.33246  ORF Transcript_20593/g.33246 Transcript_20593/m.33246 type:complete len:96 (-) Transcript_20593:35-322(-)